MTALLVAHEFLDVVSLGIVGPLPITEGVKYLFTFLLTILPVLWSDSHCEARHWDYCEESVSKIITQYGVPKKLLTDRRAKFTSALIRYLQITENSEDADEQLSSPS